MRIPSRYWFPQWCLVSHLNIDDLRANAEKVRKGRMILKHWVCFHLLARIVRPSVVIVLNNKKNGSAHELCCHFDQSNKNFIYTHVQPKLFPDLGNVSCCVLKQFHPCGCYSWFSPCTFPTDLRITEKVLKYPLYYIFIFLNKGFFPRKVFFTKGFYFEWRSFLFL